MILLALFACDFLNTTTDCVQLDVIPAVHTAYSMNQTDVQVSACVCSLEGELCSEENLIPMVEVQMSTNLGQLSSENLFLSNGRGVVGITGGGNVGLAYIQAALGSFRGGGSIELTDSIPFTKFELTSNAETVQAGESPVTLMVEIEPSYDGQPVDLSVYPSDIGQLSPSNQVAAYGGFAEFLYVPPSEYYQNETLRFIAQSGSDLSNSVFLELTSATNFFIQPASITLPLGEEVTFRLQGNVLEPFWTVSGPSDVTCDGGPLSLCDGKTEVKIAVTSCDGIGSTFCNVTLRATDDVTGEQVSASIIIQ